MEEGDRCGEGETIASHDQAFDLQEQIVVGAGLAYVHASVPGVAVHALPLAGGSTGHGWPDGSRGSTTVALEVALAVSAGCPEVDCAVAVAVADGTMRSGVADARAGGLLAVPLVGPHAVIKNSTRTSIPLDRMATPVAESGRGSNPHRLRRAVELGLFAAILGRSRGRS